MFAAAGILLIVGGAIFYVAFVEPARRTHRTLGDIGEINPARSAEAFYYRERQKLASAVEGLGGPAHAIRSLRFYLRLPRWMAPRRIPALLCLGLCGEEAVPVLGRALDDEDETTRRAAVMALGQTGGSGKEILSILETPLADEASSVREAVAEGLGRWMHENPAAKKAIPALRRALADEHVRVRKAAADSLGRCCLAEEEALPVLAKAYEDKEVEVRKTAISSLQASVCLNRGRTARGAVNILLGAVQDEDEDVRRLAVMGLSGVRPSSREVVRTLVMALKDRSGRVRHWVAESLLTIGPSAEEASALAEAVVNDEGSGAGGMAAEALVKIGPPAVPALVGLLKSDNIRVRLVAIRSLGEMGSAASAAIPDLEKALESPKPWVRKRIREALEKIRSTPDVPDAPITP